MAGIKITPSGGGAELAMVNLPSANAVLNPAAFAGDGGQSYVRGIAAGQALVEPLEKGVLSAVEYDKPENVAAREFAKKKMAAESMEMDLNNVINSGVARQLGLNTGGGDLASANVPTGAAGGSDLSSADGLGQRMINAKIAKLTGTEDPAKRDAAIKQKSIEEAQKMLMQSGRFKAGMTNEEILNAVSGSSTLTPDQLKAHNQINDDYQKDKYIEKAKAAKGALDVINAGLDRGDGLGDIAAINQFQSGLVDPGATVRAEDIKLIQTAQSFMANLDPKYWIAKLEKGAKLPEQTRSQMRKLSSEIMKMRAKNAGPTNQRYKTLGEKSGVDPSLFLEDFSEFIPAEEAGPKNAAGKGAEASPAAGNEGVTPNGLQFKIKKSK